MTANTEPGQAGEAGPTSQQGPPTILQQPDGEGPPPTILQQPDGEGPPPTILQSSNQATDAEADVRHRHYPQDLLARYEPVEKCGEGTEAAVWRARRVPDGAEVAVKVNWAGSAVDPDLLRHLDNPRFHRHVPKLFDFGEIATPYGGAGWVAMEFIPDTLADLMSRERRPAGGLNEERATEIVAELANAVRFWQDPDAIDRTPIDVKPDNFGVRRCAPVELVLLDFGGVARHSVTQRVGTVNAARGYMSPEGVLGERHPASPWWSLGVIAYELITGGTRFRRPDGSLLPDNVVRRDIILGDVDTSGVPYERWRLLLRGLFTRDPADRWGWRQVDQWLRGGTPRVVMPSGFVAAATVEALEPITFRGRSYRDPAKLARAMLSQQDEAARWLATDAARLRDWLREQVRDNRFDTGYLAAIDAGATERAQVTLLAFGAAYAPDVTPRYRRRPVDADGIFAICTSGRDGGATIRMLLAEAALPVAAQYTCGHPDCATAGRCAVLDRVADEVPEIVAGVQRTAMEIGREIGQTAGSGVAIAWPPLSAAEQDRATTTAAALIVRPEIRANILNGLRGGGNAPWWRRLRREAKRADPTTRAGLVTLACAAPLRDRANAAAATAKAARGRARGATQRTARGGPGQWRARGAVAALSVLLLLLLSWSAAVIAQMITARDNTLMSPRPGYADFGRAVGSAAGADIYPLVPLIIGVAVAIAVAVSAGRQILLGGSVGATALGFAMGRIPPFPLAMVLHEAYPWLVSLGGAWKQWTGIAAVFYCPVAALVLCIPVGHLINWINSRRGAPARRIDLARLPPGWRPVVVGAIAFIALADLVWAAAVIHMTTSVQTAPGFVVGATAAGYQSGLIPACAILAAAVAVLPRTGARRAVIAGALAAAAAGFWPARLPTVGAIWHPIAAAPLASLAHAWGDGVFWAAVLVYLPAAWIGLRVVLRERSR